MERVTLSEALAFNDLKPFIPQAKADGLSPGRADFDAVLARLNKAPLPSARTSSSPAHDWFARMRAFDAIG